jgi:hypothetical protein
LPFKFRSLLRSSEKLPEKAKEEGRKEAKTTIKNNNPTPFLRPGHPFHIAQCREPLAK